MIVKDLDVTRWQPWRTFLEEYASACRSRGVNERAQIIVVARGVPMKQIPRSAPALNPMVWDGVVGEIDALAYALDAFKGTSRHPSCLTKLLARTTAALALWDFEFADRLVALDWREIVDPARLRDALACVAGDTGNATWEGGGVGNFEGELLFHTGVLLATGDVNHEVARRVWAAQAAELLPRLELRRRDLVKRMKGTHRIPHTISINGEHVDNLADLEIGELLYLAQKFRLPADVSRTAGLYRQLRNKLAHLTPLDADELYEFLAPHAR